MTDLSTHVEDYLEAILKHIKRKGYAQTKDIAAELNVKPPSVSEMLSKLKSQGLVNYKKYSTITLTSLGEEFAEKVLEGHNTIKKLLMFLGVPADIAEDDACVMEHKIHPKTMKQLKSFVNFIKSYRDSPDWLETFEKYCKKG